MLAMVPARQYNPGTMRRITGQLKAATLATTLLVALAVTGPGSVMAAVDGPSLIISQLKMTSSNGQSITLYNTSTSPLDMSRFQLEYFNHYDLDKATSSRLIPLAGSLPPHSYYIVNDDTVTLCYKTVVDSISLGLSTTAGMIEVLDLGQASPGTPALPTLQDYVAWSKTAASGVQVLPASTDASLQRQPRDQSNRPLVDVPGAGTWQAIQPDPNNSCSFITVTNPSQPVNTDPTQLLPSSEPPATLLNTNDLGQAPALPTTDIGLMAPQITELLPNPIGSGNDSSDEFIELYNPNAAAFDLSSFYLRTGLTGSHTYTFPAGTTLPPRSFMLFILRTRH